MRTWISAAVFIAILAGGLALGQQPLTALPEYTEKEHKECDFCHPAGDLFALNDAGKYYAEHNHSFEGYESPEPPEPAKPKPVEPPKPYADP
jgi:hypothetical protein